MRAAYRFAFLILALLTLKASRVQALDYAKIPIKRVSPCLPSEVRAGLLAKRALLLNRVKEYNDQADIFLQKCRAVRNDETALIQYCTSEKSRLEGLQVDIANAATDFKSEVEQAEFAPAGEVVAAMEAASTELRALPPKDRGTEPQGRQPKGRPDKRPPVTDNCRDFFERVVKNLGEKRDKTGGEWQTPFPSLNADQIATTLINPETRPASWRELNPLTEAQQLANHGALVVAALPANLHRKPPRRHGHLAIVLPLSPSFDVGKYDPKDLKGSGPFVRDGNEHDFRNKGLGFALASWGAIKASRATVPEETKWFLFVPSFCDDAKEQ